MGQRTIVIVGGGASGTCVAINLARLAAASLRIVVIEPRAELGLGPAYSTPYWSHLLNVRAGNMSALADHAAHFFRWLQKSYPSDVAADSFVPRPLYGRYLRETLAEVLRDKPLVNVEHRRDQAARVDPSGSGCEVTLTGGTQLSAGQVVLALGNESPRNPIPITAGVEVFSSWASAAYKGLASDVPVLLIGSGLTAVDAVLALNEEGHRGLIYVISRHGKWPLIHGDPAPPISFPRPEDLHTVRSLMRQLRSIAREREQAGDNWRTAVDSIRPHTGGIWTRLSITERRRFLRHGRWLWDIHRHRMAGEVGAKLAAIRDCGRLKTFAGRVIEAGTNDGSLARVRLGLRNGGEMVLDVGRIINCTGPAGDLADSSNPVLRNLIRSGAGTADQMRLGLVTNEHGALIAADGSTSNTIFTLGPPRRGMLWESVAMPEIRVQARALAQSLLEIRSPRLD